MFRSYNIQRSLKIDKSDLVLEVGSGANPLMRSDVLLDKYPILSEKHRTSQKPALFDGRPFVVGDVLDLPFLDNAFDFIIARHLLEHLSDPKRFVSEIKRVGKACYIATPSPFTELIHGGHPCTEEGEEFSRLHLPGGTPGHKWFVLSSGNHIFLLPKSADTYSVYLLFSYFIQNNTSYERDSFFRKHADFRETRLRCENTEDLNVIVLKEAGNDVEVDEEVDINRLMSDFHRIHASRSLKSMIKGFLSRRIFTSRKKADLAGLLACPICKNPLLRGEARLICKECGSFPVVDHVPILLREALNTA